MLIAVDQGEPGNFERQIARWFKIADQGRPGDRWLIDTVRFDEAVHKASRPKSSSQVTLCWRKADSNSRSRSREKAYRVLAASNHSSAKARK
jgi:hypothetical protein